MPGSSAPAASKRPSLNLSTDLNIGPNDTNEALEQEFFSHSIIPEAEWPALIEVLASGSKSDNNHIERLEAARTAFGRARVDNYLKVFCTAELKPRKTSSPSRSPRNIPTGLTRLMAEQDRVCQLLARERAVAARDRTSALVTIAAEVIKRYRRRERPPRAARL